MNKETTWADVRESVARLNSTLEMVERQIKGRSSKAPDPFGDMMEKIFSGKPPGKWKTG